MVKLMEDMTFYQIKEIKDNINEFIIKLSDEFIKNGKDMKQSDQDFYIFLSKQIIFMKKLYLGMGKPYFFKVIISDLYNFILSIINNDLRYVYLNERSIIENYVRAVMKTSVDEDHVTQNVFNKLKEKQSIYGISDDEFSLILSEYRTSCGYIHGGIALDDTLSFVFDDCIFNKTEIKKINNYYERLRKIFQCFNKMLICEYGNIISGCFHRQKSTFEYLLGKKSLELLFSVNH